MKKKHLSYRGLHLRMSGVIKASCHVSTTESIGNHCEFVSKKDLLPDLNVVNSEANSTVENGANEFIEYLQNLRIETSGGILIGNLNINSIRNKVDILSYMIGNNIDIRMISESKLDDTFTTSQFVIDSFTEPFRLDRTRNGGVVYYFMLKITLQQHC